MTIAQINAQTTGTGGSSTVGQGLFTMSLQEFWAVCRGCHIPTPHLNLAKIDLLFITVDSKNKNTPHNPSRAFVLHEYMEGLLRLSVLKQKGTKDAKDTASAPDKRPREGEAEGEKPAKVASA